MIHLKQKLVLFFLINLLNFAYSLFKFSNQRVKPFPLARRDIETVHESEGTVIESGKLNLGSFENKLNWHSWDKCDKGLFVTGLRGQFENPPNKDKPHKNKMIGFELFCGLPGSKSKRVIHRIGFSRSDLANSGSNSEEEFHLSHNDQGDNTDNQVEDGGGEEDEDSSNWSENQYCEGTAIGFQIQGKKMKGSYPLINLRIICNNNNETLTPFVKQSVKKGKTWRFEQRCKENEAICGVRLLTKEYGKDYGAIYQVQMKCCDYRHSIESCIPSDRWELLFRYNNLNGLQPALYSYSKKVGISKTSGVIYVRSQELTGDIEGSPGGEVKLLEILELIKRFSGKLSFSASTEYDWSQANSITWSKEKSSQISVTILPGYVTEIWQVVGTCGEYTVRPDKIIQTGYFSQYKENQNSRLGYERLSMADKLGLGLATLGLMAVSAFL